MARMGDPLNHMGPAMPAIAMVGTGKKPSLRGTIYEVPVMLQTRFR